MAKKMNTQRSDGRYMVKVYVGVKDGKKAYKYVYGKTQKEADIKADELKVSLTCGKESNYIVDTIGCYNFCPTGSCTEAKEDEDLIC